VSVRDMPGFLRDYPCEVWCVMHPFKRPLAWFLQSPEWRPVFYGACGAVFARRDRVEPDCALTAGRQIGALRNLHQALLVLSFALNTRDWDGAERLVAGMEERFQARRHRDRVAGARDLLEGMRAFHHADYETALRHLSQTSRAAPGYLAASHLHAARVQWQQQNTVAAADHVGRALVLQPRDPLTLYNAGIVQWELDRSGAAAGSAADWRRRLNQALHPAPGAAPLPRRARHTAEQILAGRFAARPRLLAPEPAAPSPVRAEEDE